MRKEIREFQVTYLENGVKGVELFKVERPWNPVEEWNKKYPSREPIEMKRVNMDIEATLEDYRRIYEEEVNDIER